MTAVEPPMPPGPQDFPMEDATEGEAPPPSIEEMVEGSAPETVNLVDSLKPDEQTDIARRVVEDYERDMKSGEKFRQRRSRIVRLALGDIPTSKDGDRFRIAKIHYPIIMTAVTRIQTRLYDQQFPSNGEYFGVKPIDATDLERAVRVAKHMNWQVTHQIPEYVPNHDVLLMQMLLYGSAFTRVYYDRRRKRICHEVCATDDIILPYTWKRGKNDPSMSEFPRITYLVRYYRDELEEMRDDGYYSNVDQLYKAVENGQTINNDELNRTPQKMREVIDRDSGTDKPTDETDAPRVILYQCRKLKLPGQKVYKPVVVEVDLSTRTLLCLKIREDADPQDKARYNREKRANDAVFESAMQQYKMDLLQYLAGRMAPSINMSGAEPGAMTPPPIAGEQTMTSPPAPGVTTSTIPMVDPNMPQPPRKPEDPEPPRMVPINFFTHYMCFPNPEGVYGLGIGSLLEGNNVAADTIASQYIDSATLASTPTGIRSRQAKIRGGDFNVKPGEFIESDLSPDELKQGGGILQLKFPGPDGSMRQMIQDQIEAGDKLSGAGDILSGELGGSNMTATQAQIQISQALSQIAIINKRVTRARTSEAEKIARLNSVYLDDVEYFYVIDPFKNVPPEEVKVGRMDYLEDTDVTITADPRMASQPQRFQEAMNAIQVTSQIPVLQGNAPLWMALVKNLYISMDRPDFIAAMEQGLQPPPGAPPPGAPGMPPVGPMQTTEGPRQGNSQKPQPRPTTTRVPNSPKPQPANGEQEQGQVT